MATLAAKSHTVSVAGLCARVVVSWEMLRTATRSLPLLALLGAFGCSRQGDPLPWISEHSAVVRCESPGKRPPPPAAVGLPAPPVPTGLFARQLDPAALDALGYTRDAVACATLEAPTAARIDAAAGLRAIIDLHDRTSREALRAGGRCTCEIARAQGVRDLVAACVQTPTIGGCDPTVNAAEVEQAVAPLLVALEDVVLPWMHWRLVGPTDRPGWFAAHINEAIANHDGGSLVYLPNEPLPPRADAAVRAMLSAQDVVAVVRQDGGRALVVAREVDGLLVLDHFRQPLASPERMPLVARIEAAQVSAMAALLSPGPTRPPLARLGNGTLMEFDRLLLEEVDRAAVATGALLGIDSELPAAPGPVPLVDRVAYVAPYGESGRVLRVEHALSVDGLAWAQTLSTLPLVGNLGALGLSSELELPSAPPKLRVAGVKPAKPVAVAGRFVLRGTATARWGIAGVYGFPTLANLLEIAAPGALGGDLSNWRIDWPGTDLPSELGAGEPVASRVFEGLRRLVAAGPYRLEASFDPRRTRLVLEVRPR